MRQRLQGTAALAVVLAMMGLVGLAESPNAQDGYVFIAQKKAKKKPAPKKEEPKTDEPKKEEPKKDDMSAAGKTDPAAKNGEEPSLTPRDDRGTLPGGVTIDSASPLEALDIYLRAKQFEDGRRERLRRAAEDLVLSTDIALPARAGACDA